MKSKLVEYKIELSSVKSSRVIIKALKLKSKSVDFSKQQYNEIRNYNNALKRLNSLNKQFKYAKQISGEFSEMRRLQDKKVKTKKLLQNKLEKTLGVKSTKDGIKYRYNIDGSPKRGLLQYSLKHGTTTIEKLFKSKPASLGFGGLGGGLDSGLQSAKPFELMSKSEVVRIVQQYNVEYYIDSFNGRNDDGWIRRVQKALGAEHLGVQEFLEKLNKIMI